MKLNKLMIILATLALTGCGSKGGSSVSNTDDSSASSQPEELKQPQITATEAKNLSESIFNYIDESFEDVVVPSECTLRYNQAYNQEMVSGENSSTSSMSSSYLAIYSETNGIFYSESAHEQNYDGHKTTACYKQWVFVEGDSAYMFQISIEDDEEPKYGYESGDASEFDLKEYASYKIALENSDVIYDYIDEFYYSDTTPELDTDVEGIDVTFDSYYGSYNESSLQAKEDFTASCLDCVIDDTHLSVIEQSSSQIWIENYLVSHFETIDEVSQSKLDSKDEVNLFSEFTYNLSEVAESVPELDKTLFVK